MRTRRSLLSMIAVCVLTACATHSDAGEQAAIIVQSNDQSRAALQSTLDTVFGGTIAPLTDHALTQDSILFVEHVRPRDGAGRLIQGRETRRPEKFVLVTDGQRCILIRENTGERFKLAHTQCVAKP